MCKQIKTFLRINVLNWKTKQVIGQIVPGNGIHKTTNPVYALGWSLRKKLRMSQFCHISKRFFDPFFDGFYVTFENTQPPKILELQSQICQQWSFGISGSLLSLVLDATKTRGWYIIAIMKAHTHTHNHNQPPFCPLFFLLCLSFFVNPLSVFPATPFPPITLTHTCPYKKNTNGKQLLSMATPFFFLCFCFSRSPFPLCVEY